MSKKKLKIGVFFGGSSSEKEISLESGRNIYNHLDREKYDVTPVFIDQENQFWQVNESLVWMNTTADINLGLKKQGKRIFYEDLKKIISFAFLGLHGKFVEDGCLQGLLEILEIPYNGSGVLGGAIGLDKFFQRKLLKAAGLAVPQHQGILGRDWKKNKKKILKEIKEKFDFPLIVKPSREGCSTAITKVAKEKDLTKAIEEALVWDNLVLVEKFLEGVEVTTTILGNDQPEALLPTETPYKGDFLTLEEKFLPGDATMITPPRLPKEVIKKIQEDSVKAFLAMGLKVYARIDGVWIDNKLVILEPNTLPGLTPSTCVFHQAAEANMNPSQFLDKVINLSLKAHQNKTGAL